MGRRLAEAANAWRARRTRGETGLRRFWEVFWALGLAAEVLCGTATRREHPAGIAPARRQPDWCRPISKVAASVSLACRGTTGGGSGLAPSWLEGKSVDL